MNDYEYGIPEEFPFKEEPDCPPCNDSGRILVDGKYEDCECQKPTPLSVSEPPASGVGGFDQPPPF